MPVPSGRIAVNVSARSTMICDAIELVERLCQIRFGGRIPPRECDVELVTALIEIFVQNECFEVQKCFGSELREALHILRASPWLY